MGHGTRNLYRLDELGEKLCVSCLGANTTEPPVDRANLTESEQANLELEELVEKCMYFDASFGSSSDWFLLNCLGK